MDNILEVKNLSVSFGKEKVIKKIGFNLKPGENLVVLGPNGAGKTTLLKALLGVAPFGGEIKWANGVKIGYVPQKFLLERTIPLTVEEFFGFKKLSAEKIFEAIDSVGLKDNAVLKKKIGDISFGQLQRILIAWALVGDPNVLLFDEPLAGIDIEGEETIYNLLSKIEKERNLTIIMVTHDLNIVHKIANVVLCLNGKFSCFGAPEQVLTQENFRRLYGEDTKLYRHVHN